MRQYPFFKVDHHADAVYVKVRPGDHVARTEQISPAINADYDVYGNVLGIEFLTVKMDFGLQFAIEKEQV